MCGGSLETVVCSVVGHIFRSRSPYKWNINVKDPLKRNLLRLADVWLDDYKRFYHARIGFNTVSLLYLNCICFLLNVYNLLNSGIYCL